MKNLIQAAVVTLFAASSAQAQQAVQWRVEDGGNGHWYQVVSTSLTWAAAHEYAMKQGSHLVTVTSASEQGFLWSLAGSAVPLNDFWIGAYQTPSSCEPGCAWRWVTDEPFGYVDWDSGEPNNNPVYGDEDAVCVNERNAWNDLASSATRRSVIEWDADCNNDGIVDYGQCRDGSLPDYNGNNIPDCCEQGTPCVVGLYPVQWRVEDGGNGHWYAGIVTSLSGASWSTAREIATSQGADLTKVLSPSHRQWLFDRIVSSPALWSESAGPWVGGLQALGSIEPAGGWMWVDDTEIAEGVWSPGQPDNSTDCGGDNNRMGFWNGGSGVPQPWLEDSPDGQVYTPCVGTRVSAVLEWSADCNADGIVDYGQILQGQLADFNTDGVPDICQQPTCADADIYRDFNVNGADLGILLSQWGPNTPLTESDLNGDGIVSGADLGLLLANWGPCPN
jgi:hypothetical protein